MRSREAKTQYSDPTHWEATIGAYIESTIVELPEFPHFGPREYRLRAAALCQLDRMYPRQGRKRPSKRHPEYRRLLEEIALGNFDVATVLVESKGGVK